MQQNLYRLLQKVEISKLPPVSPSLDAINLFGEDSETAGLETLLKSKTKNINEVSKNFSFISTIITTALTSIVVFPEKLTFNPKLEAFVKDDYFGYIWLISIVITVLLWLVYSIKQIRLEKEKNKIERIKSQIKLSIIQNTIFTGFYQFIGNNPANEKKFGEQDFTKYLLNYISFKNEYDSDIDLITTSIIGRALEKEQIVKVPNVDQVGLDTFYKFTK